MTPEREPATAARPRPRALASRRATPRPRREPTAADIVAYYEQCEIDYRMVWDLGTSLAMHYGHWDEKTRTLRQALRRQNELLAETARLTAADQVLDAGCGVGGSAIFLTDRLGCRVTGVTLSVRQAAAARRNAARRGLGALARFAVMDYSATAFRPATFDVVWALESVCYAADKRAFVREAHRLLRPGGRLVLADGFAARERYTGSERATMAGWLHNWAVRGLDTVERFAGHLDAEGFRTLVVRDVTANVMPSSRRLYLRSLCLPLGRVAEYLGMRSRIQTGNILGCQHQYAAFRQGLGRYALFLAERR